MRAAHAWKETVRWTFREFLWVKGHVPFIDPRLINSWKPFPLVYATKYSPQMRGKRIATLWSFFVLQSWWVGSRSGSLLSCTYPFQANITWFLISISLPFTIILSTQTEESESTAICEMTVLGTAYILVFSSTLFWCLRQLVYFYNNYNNEHRFLSLLESQLIRGHARSKFFAVQNAGWKWRNWKLLCSICLGLSAVRTRQQIEQKDSQWTVLQYDRSGRGFFFTHCGQVTQICVFTLQLCRTGDAGLRF
jgi:hypothetical protein